MVEAEGRVSHGFCPECFDKTMAQFSLAWAAKRRTQPAPKSADVLL